MTSPHCQQFEELLDDYRRGGLDTLQRKAVEAHLAACVDCAQALSDAEGIARLLQDSADVPMPGREYFATLTRRVVGAAEGADPVRLTSGVRVIAPPVASNPVGTASQPKERSSSAWWLQIAAAFAFGVVLTTIATQTFIPDSSQFVGVSMTRSKPMPERRTDFAEGREIAAAVDKELKKESDTKLRDLAAVPAAPRAPERAVAAAKAEMAQNRPQQPASEPAPSGGMKAAEFKADRNRSAATAVGGAILADEVEARVPATRREESYFADSAKAVPSVTRQLAVTEPADKQVPVASASAVAPSDSAVTADSDRVSGMAVEQAGTAGVSKLKQTATVSSKMAERQSLGRPVAAPSAARAQTLDEISTVNSFDSASGRLKAGKDANGTSVGLVFNEKEDLGYAAAANKPGKSAASEVYFRGEEARFRGQYEGAVALFQKAAELAPGSEVAARANLRIAEICDEKLKDPVRARDAYEACLTANLKVHFDEATLTAIRARFEAIQTDLANR
ncbi:MAG: zf-HC2 domain-containing protein [Candidatus Sumerlaeaceae bacterium]|nr:zf-HC2 domain-containing protein [Candidatus Sumerlaeaceae bacterium]